MKRMMIAALLGAVFFLCSHRPAYALSEFCPATLRYEAVGPQSAANVPAALYGFELSALGPRTIASAALSFDTSGGWYSVKVPSVTLSAKQRRYTGPSSTFIRQDYVSPVLYLQFPKPVSVAHAWVFSTATQGDSQFGWDKDGTVECSPMTQGGHLISIDRGASTPPAPKPPEMYNLDSKDGDTLRTSPQAGAVVIAASPVQALENRACNLPFKDAMVERPAIPQYPAILRAAGVGETTTTIQVAIAADGTLRDAWVADPSGYPAADAASLASARYSTYEAARAYCRPVPSIYYFFVEFDPN